MRHLRRREHWTQTELANKLGVHRATLARWEACEGDPPIETAHRMAEIFRVDVVFLFQSGPLDDHPAEAGPDRIEDPWLRRFPVAKLQKFTKAALRASGLTLTQISKKVKNLSVQRIQELMDGAVPTVYEIQLLRDRLGSDFNPVSSLRKRILAGTANDEIEDQSIESRLEQLENTQKLLIRMASRIEQLENTQKEFLEKLERFLPP